MKAANKISNLGFYSNEALVQKGRLTAVSALDELITDIEVLIASNSEYTKTLQIQIEQLENGIFPSRPPSKLESAFALCRMYEELAYRKKLDQVCKYNLGACMARKKELRV